MPRPTAGTPALEAQFLLQRPVLYIMVKLCAVQSRHLAYETQIEFDPWEKIDAAALDRGELGRSEA